MLLGCKSLLRVGSSGSFLLASRPHHTCITGPRPLTAGLTRSCAAPWSAAMRLQVREQGTSSSPFPRTMRPAALTSPSAPLAHVLAAASSSSSSAGGPVLHTDYAGATTSSSSSATPICAPSFQVTDVAAFEALIHEALHVTPAAAPSKTLEPTSASSTVLTNHTVRELQALLAQAEAALAIPASRQATVDRYAYDVYLPLLKYGTFALLALQFGVYFNWIFFVFDWNLVEPTTYFLGYTGVFCSLVYHYRRCGEDEFTWRHLFQYMAHRAAMKMYEEQKVDVEEVARLRARIAVLQAELAQVTV